MDADPDYKRARNEQKNQAKQQRVAEDHFIAIQGAQGASTLPAYLVDAPNDRILKSRRSAFLSKLFSWQQPLVCGLTFAECWDLACAGKQGISIALGTLDMARFLTQVGRSEAGEPPGSSLPLFSPIPPEFPQCRRASAGATSGSASHSLSPGFASAHLLTACVDCATRAGAGGLQHLD